MQAKPTTLAITARDLIDRMEKLHANSTPPSEDFKREVARFVAGVIQQKPGLLRQADSVLALVCRGYLDNAASVMRDFAGSL